MAEGKDVFISYHRATMAETLRRIADELKNRGISFWYDTENLKSGHYAETIEEEIKRCKVFLFIWDDGANNSTWCRDEVVSALAHKKHVFLFRVNPLKTENAELNLRLRPLHAFETGNPPDQERIQELAETIADTVHNGPATWKMVYERDEQLKKQETETWSMKWSISNKERRIAELEEELQQADSQIQAVKNKLGQKQSQIEQLQALRAQAQRLADELAREQDWVQVLELNSEAEWEQERNRTKELEKALKDKRSKVKFLTVLSILLGVLTFILVCILLFPVFKWLLYSDSGRSTGEQENADEYAPSSHVTGVTGGGASTPESETHWYTDGPSITDAPGGSLVNSGVGMPSDNGYGPGELDASGGIALGEHNTHWYGPGEGSLDEDVRAVIPKPVAPTDIIPGTPEGETSVGEIDPSTVGLSAPPENAWGQSHNS